MTSFPLSPTTTKNERFFSYRELATATATATSKCIAKSREGTCLDAVPYQVGNAFVTDRELAINPRFLERGIAHTLPS